MSNTQNTPNIIISEHLTNEGLKNLYANKDFEKALKNNDYARDIKQQIENICDNEQLTEETKHNLGRIEFYCSQTNYFVFKKRITPN